MKGRKHSQETKDRIKQTLRDKYESKNGDQAPADGAPKEDA